MSKHWKLLRLREVKASLVLSVTLAFAAVR